MSLIYLLPCHNSQIPNWSEQYKNCALLGFCIVQVLPIVVRIKSNYFPYPKTGKYGWQYSYALRNTMTSTETTFVTLS